MASPFEFNPVRKAVTKAVTAATTAGKGVSAYATRSPGGLKFVGNGITPTMMDVNPATRVNPAPPGTNPRVPPGTLSPPGGGFQAQVVGPTAGQSTADIAKMQQFLRNRGYNIVVDGVNGVSTSSALNDYQSGGGKRDAKAWTQKNAPFDDSADVTPRGPSNNQDVGPRDSAVVTKDGKVVKTKGKGGKATWDTAREARNAAYWKSHPKPGKGDVKPGKLSNTGGDGSVFDRFDPDILARASMEAKYGPQMAELLRQEKASTLSTDYRQGEIQEMYGTYTKDIKNRNIDSANARQGMVDATTGLPAAIAGGVAMGEAERASLAQTGAIDATYAQQMATSGTQYDNRMAEAAQGGSTFAQMQAQQAGAADVKGIRDKRTDMVAQRGADLVSTRLQLQQWKTEQTEKTRQFNVGVASDKRKDDIAITQLIAANAMLPVEQRMKEAELQKMIAEIGYTKAQTAQVGKPDAANPADAPFPSQFTKMTPPQRADLQQSIMVDLDRLQGEGKTVGTPQIVKLINARLRGAGYKPIANKAVGDFAFNTAKAAGAVGVSRKYWNSKK